MPSLTGMNEDDEPHEYSDDVSTQEHCRILADHIERKPVESDHWPVVNLGAVLPSARAMIVRALRELEPSLPR